MGTSLLAPNAHSSYKQAEQGVRYVFHRVKRRTLGERQLEPCACEKAGRWAVGERTITCSTSPEAIIMLLQVSECLIYSHTSLAVFLWRTQRRPQPSERYADADASVKHGDFVGDKVDGCQLGTKLPKCTPGRVCMISAPNGRCRRFSASYFSHSFSAVFYKDLQPGSLPVPSFGPPRSK
jgi:hypothetical protein